MSAMTTPTLDLGPDLSPLWFLQSLTATHPTDWTAYAIAVGLNPFAGHAYGEGPDIPSAIADLRAEILAGNIRHAAPPADLSAQPLADRPAIDLLKILGLDRPGPTTTPAPGTVRRL